MTNGAAGPSGPRVLIIGASGSTGLGYRGVPFPVLTADALGAAEVLNLAVSGELLETTLAAHLDDIVAFRPDLAVLDLGGAEAIVHPHRSVQERIERWAPARFHGVTELAPRARYSSDTRQRRRQRIETAAKVAIKRVLIGLNGGAPRVPLEEYLPHAVQLLDLLEQLGTFSVVRELPHADPRLFPGTTESRRRYSAELRRLADARPLLHFVETDRHLHFWDDFLPDRFHLDGSGHRRMAELLTPPLREHWQRRTAAGPSAQGAAADD